MGTSISRMFEGTWEKTIVSRRPNRAPRRGGARGGEGGAGGPPAREKISPSSPTGILKTVKNQNETKLWITTPPAKLSIANRADIRATRERDSGGGGTRSADPPISTVAGSARLMAAATRPRAA